MSFSNQISFPKSPLSALNYVGGQWQKPTGAEMIVSSPYSGQTVGSVYCSTKNDVQQVVEKAQAAYRQWSARPLRERCAILQRAHSEIIQEKNEICQMIALENGKTLSEAWAGLQKGLEFLEYAFSQPFADIGGKSEVSRGVFCESRRIPLGVVAGITPFNFPAMVPMWMLPLALVTGNAFIWKPSEKTPFTATLLVEAFARAGLPPGVLSVVHGAKDSVEALITHPTVQAVGFVGSTPVARKVYQLGCQHGKRVKALGGAKNHLFLLSDAQKTEAIEGILSSFVGMAGQRCMAGSVLLAVGEGPKAQGALEDIIAGIVTRAKELKLGETLGALISKESQQFLHCAIDQATNDGAKILLDGRGFSVPAPYQQGFWLGPTVLDQISPSSQAASVELFGPILSIIRCQTLEEALSIENNCPYGNAASVFTQNGALAEKISGQARSGMVGINIGVPVPASPFSFGGIGESKFGHGDITGASGLDFWTDLKKITQRWPVPQEEVGPQYF